MKRISLISAGAIILATFVTAQTNSGNSAQILNPYARSQQFTQSAPTLVTPTRVSSATQTTGTIPQQSGTDIAKERAQIAMTSPEYPVTPGDIYSLTFITTDGPTSADLIVGSDYTVNLANLGKLDATGLLFTDLKKMIEEKILVAYKASAPQLVIQSCGTFPVFVEGEVDKASIAYFWSLSHLSELWISKTLTDDLSSGSIVTQYASNRSISVFNRSGVAKKYDLFRSWREGDRSQDPYLQPYDTVVFSRYERTVTISGEVRRPGTYQLLNGEGLKELVENYAEGFTAHADPRRLYLVRYTGDKDTRGTMQLIDYSVAADIGLKNADTVSVSSAQELLPVAYFEGALGVGINGADPQAAQRIPYTFFPGETLNSAVNKLRDKFSAVSDTSNAYILRGGTKLPVDISKFLYGKDYSTDIALVPNDTIIVPFRQFFVSVAGAVYSPGRYPYVPDRSWDYYVNIAGGIDGTRNSGASLTIVDAQGAKHPKDRIIQPEDSIVVAQNSALFYFGVIAPVVTTLASIVSIIYTVSKF